MADQPTDDEYTCRVCSWTGDTMNSAEDHSQKFGHDIHISAGDA